MPTEELRPKNWWRRCLGSWPGFNNLRIMQKDDWEDPYWRTWEHRWLGKMWGPLPINVLILLTMLLYLILFFFARD